MRTGLNAKAGRAPATYARLRRALSLDQNTRSKLRETERLFERRSCEGGANPVSTISGPRVSDFRAGAAGPRSDICRAHSTALQATTKSTLTPVLHSGLA